MFSQFGASDGGMEANSEKIGGNGMKGGSKVKGRMEWLEPGQTISVQTSIIPFIPTNHSSSRFCASVERGLNP